MFKPGLVLSTLLSFLLHICPLCAAPTNTWTKPTSGNWEEPYWSAGILPSMNFGAIEFRNPGFKALAVAPSTTANYPGSLAIQNLLVDAPSNSANQLLLNYAGLAVPLNIVGNFTVGPYGSLASHYSSLHAHVLSLNGPATFADQSVASFDTFTLGSSGLSATGSCLLADAYFQTTSNNINLGRFTQTGGTNQTQTLNMPGAGNTPLAEYDLLGGSLRTVQAQIGFFGSSGSFVQSNGVHLNTGLVQLWGFDDFMAHEVSGTYGLSGGLLSTPQLLVNGGGYTQNGGTNQTVDLQIISNGGGGLHAGSLFASNMTISSSDTRGFYSSYNQDGGTATVQNGLYVGRSGSFSLHAGTFAASNITVGSFNFGFSDRFRAIFALQGGTVLNNASFSLMGGDFAIRTSQQLGKLSLSGESTIGFQSTGIVLGFLDSHLTPWPSGNLRILNWAGSPNGGGSTQLYVGNNAQGLTPAQLSLINFYNPAGMPAATYPARILASGEIVPGPRPTLAFARTANRLVFSWSGNYQLFSATNVVGAFVPVNGASSPYTNFFTDRQRFFQLRSTN